MGFCILRQGPSLGLGIATPANRAPRYSTQALIGLRDLLLEVSARDHAVTVLSAVSALMALRRVGKPSAASNTMIGFGNPLLDGPDGRYTNRAKLAREKQRCPERPRMAAIVGHRGSISRVQTRSGLADVSHIRMQVPLPETADELCAVAQDVKAEAHDIRLGRQATEREIKRLSASGELAKIA